VLLVKKFQPSQDLPVSIVLDLDREAYPVRVLLGASEWAISVAASLAGHLSEQRQAVGLVANGSDPLATGDALPAITPHTGREHLMSVWRLLARIQINSAAQPLPALDHSAHGRACSWGATLIVVTPRLDEATLWVLHNAYRRGVECDRTDLRRPVGFSYLASARQAAGHPTFSHRLGTRSPDGDNLKHEKIMKLSLSIDSEEIAVLQRQLARCHAGIQPCLLWRTSLFDR
jgi:uncharacterized protein (DUF58 family)